MVSPYVHYIALIIISVKLNTSSLHLT